MTRYEINTSDIIEIQDGLKMDELTFETMRALGLTCFRSSKSRSKDREKAIKRYGEKVNLKDYAIHHTFSGLVGLAPLSIHKSIKHYGYFYRLSH